MGACWASNLQSESILSFQASSMTSSICRVPMAVRKAWPQAIRLSMLFIWLGGTPKRLPQ